MLTGFGHGQARAIGHAHPCIVSFTPVVGVESERSDEQSGRDEIAVDELCAEFDRVACSAGDRAIRPHTAADAGACFEEGDRETVCPHSVCGHKPGSTSADDEEIGRHESTCSERELNARRTGNS
jgi:hypothetical protein